MAKEKPTARVGFPGVVAEAAGGVFFSRRNFGGLTSFATRAGEGIARDLLAVSLRGLHSWFRGVP